MAYRLEDMTKGRIVYDRPKHSFHWKDVLRISKAIETKVKPNEVLDVVKTALRMIDEAQKTAGSPEFADYVSDRLQNELNLSLDQWTVVLQTIAKLVAGLVARIIAVFTAA